MTVLVEYCGVRFYSHPLSVITSPRTSLVSPIGGICKSKYNNYELSPFCHYRKNVQINFKVNMYDYFYKCFKIKATGNKPAGKSSEMEKKSTED